MNQNMSFFSDTQLTKAFPIANGKAEEIKTTKVIFGNDGHGKIKLIIHLYTE